MPIQLDPFQVQAIDYIQQNKSVFVSAPTGAGKTLIAEQAVEKALAHGETCIYTAPIKALSNQKYRDFRARFGEEKVGILTGDVSLNTEAPVLIMTTEIYRNSLFDNLERFKNVGWVIFDEIHYLDDPERGTVWEEALLFTPESVRILALSATLPNLKELTDWIQSIHHRRPITIIEETYRPVPLSFIYQCQGRFFEHPDELRQEGYFNRENWKLSNRERMRGVRIPKAKPNRLDHLLKHLIHSQRLPLIYFVFGRRRAETLAWEAVEFNFLSETERPQIAELYGSLLARYDLVSEKSAVEIRPLIEAGIAYHHAGMLPTLKEVIEQLFTSRMVKVIFTTETFALGINMPARSVAFDELQKFYGSGFRNLSTRDFYQMAGRAGRRGLDDHGYVYARVLPHYIPFPEVQRIIYGKPEPISSQLNTTYATLLNLYRDLGDKLIEIYPKTFHFFQSSQRKRDDGLHLIQRKLELLKQLGYMNEAGLTGKGEFAASLFGHELILSEMHAEGRLDALSETNLNILLASLVFEPRKGDHPPQLSGDPFKLQKSLQHYFYLVHRNESKLHIHPYTRPPHWNLSAAVQAWSEGRDFNKLFRLTGADEGELIRYFRMVIQLLRELIHAPHTSSKLKETARKGLRGMNRDVVDAEKQLRV